jgi:hypothetical protein
MEETPWTETNQRSQDRGEGCSSYFWFHPLPELPDICNRTTFKLVWQNLITRGLDTANHLAFVQARGLIFWVGMYKAICEGSNPITGQSVRGAQMDRSLAITVPFLPKQSLPYFCLSIPYCYFWPPFRAKDLFAFPVRHLVPPVSICGLRYSKL